MSRFVRAGTLMWVVVMAEPGMGATADHSLHGGGAPAIKGNPAADPTLAPRFGRPGRLLFRCTDLAGGKESADIFASAEDFDEGKQSFFIRRSNPKENEVLYPLHGHFLDGGTSGVFMVHDGKGTKEGEQFRMDQSVNMGLVLFRVTGGGVRAILDIVAEEGESGPTGPALGEYSCTQGDTALARSPQATHVRARPNSGATPPSHWFRESDRALLNCAASGSAGAYRLELLGSTVWPGHLGFLVVHAPGGRPPVGYNVHLLEGAGRLLIHAHSYPHQTRTQKFDTMMETETVIGGVLLVKAEGGYAGWVGLVSAPIDPYNLSFSREATMGDYSAWGRAVIPPLPVTCAISSPAGR